MDSFPSTNAPLCVHMCDTRVRVCVHACPPMQVHKCLRVCACRTLGHLQAFFFRHRSCLSFWDKASHWPAVQQGRPGWLPVTPRELLKSASPVLGLKTHTMPSISCPIPRLWGSDSGHCACVSQVPDPRGISPALRIHFLSISSF